jgi:hypothetical protein
LQIEEQRNASVKNDCFSESFVIMPGFASFKNMHILDVSGKCIKFLHFEYAK